MTAQFGQLLADWWLRITVAAFIVDVVAWSAIVYVWKRGRRGR